MTPNRVTEKTYPNSQTLKEGIEMTSRMRSVTFKALLVGLASLVLVFAGSSNATLAGGDPPPPGFILVLVQGQAKLCTDGKAVQGAKVILFSKKNHNLKVETTTNAEGKFSATAILFGAHVQEALADVGVEFPGFAIGQMTPIVLSMPFFGTFISVTACLQQALAFPVWYNAPYTCCETDLKFMTGLLNPGEDGKPGRTWIDGPEGVNWRVVEITWEIELAWSCKPPETNPPMWCIGSFHGRVIKHPTQNGKEPFRAWLQIGVPPADPNQSFTDLTEKCTTAKHQKKVTIRYTGQYSGTGPVTGPVELYLTTKELPEETLPNGSTIPKTVGKKGEINHFVTGVFGAVGAEKDKKTDADRKFDVTPRMVKRP
jgi:hypothetical protein